jgi:hypothetical protein
MIYIQPVPTVLGMQRALGNAPGVAIPIKYIRIGKGLQSIELDDAGRATSENLKSPVGYIEILTAKKVSPYQWQCVVDVKNAHNGTDFNFSEFTICDSDKQTIAIYGNATQSLYAVTDVLDNALLAVNLTLATLPANSIEIIHQNLPLSLMIEEEMATMLAATGAATVTIMQQEQRLLSMQSSITALQQLNAANTQAVLVKIDESELRTESAIRFVVQKFETEMAGVDEIGAATLAAAGAATITAMQHEQHLLALQSSTSAFQQSSTTAAADLLAQIDEAETRVESSMFSAVGAISISIINLKQEQLINANT